MSVGLPLPRGPRALKVKLRLTWTWNRTVTRLVQASIGRFPARTRISVRCLGRSCPRPNRLAATGDRRLLRLIRRLDGRRYRAGDRLLVVLRAPGWVPERAEVLIRDSRLPRVRAMSG